MTTYDLTLSPSYVTNWTPIQAIKELLQNIIDSKKEYAVLYNEENKLLTLRSVNCTLSKDTLILGNTTKDDTNIGKYGEGYKLAFLVLLRENFGATLENGAKIWKPVFKYSAKFKCTLLCIEESDGDSENTDLIYNITNITPEFWEEIQDCCLLLRPTNKLNTDMGDLLPTKFKRLYINDLLITETKLKYAYNLNTKEVILDRDRSTINTFELAWKTSQLWAKLLKENKVSINEVKKLLEAGVPDVEYINNFIGVIRANELYKAMSDGTSDITYVSSQEEADNANGKTKIVPYPLKCALKASTLYKEKLEKEMAESVTDKLNEFKKKYQKQLSNAAMRSLLKIIKFSKENK